MNDYPGKRILDRVAVGLAAVVFAPFALVIVLAIWLDDRGPILFFQPRVGRNRQLFSVCKFRSMRGADVTRVGRWLRRTGLDEVPQFINVWRGDMSVIGPRPLTPDDLERLGWNSAEHDWRFVARPGISGIAQLTAGRSARFSRRMERLYLRRQSLALDLRLIALSFAANLLGKSRVRKWLK